MKISLAPMTAAAYASFKAYSIADFAEQMQRTGQWPSDQAPALAAHSFAEVLPEGLLTPGHYLFEIQDLTLGESVGAIWVGVVEEQLREGFVFDLVIHESFRRQGYAQLAMLQVEAFFKTLNVSSIALEVYADNVGARRLYDELGYQVTSQSMRKSLE
ncbi:GNAT family N-acetyltransferase [Pseudomonas sp. TH31]|uniref:GNAT family N-acetyltransferase n=1 Tax=Pseudomonas sp. TH31 TaxID=2796396 RepID=UPI0019134CFD|nr:GNAT family N-acetyltransferase [Pseudomonas sp. TH31]MBK5414301.1 GNAT family N-acetyltransferase [Pseudomonas sp. TH31]